MSTRTATGRPNQLGKKRGFFDFLACAKEEQAIKDEEERIRVEKRMKKEEDEAREMEEREKGEQLSPQEVEELE